MLSGFCFIKNSPGVATCPRTGLGETDLLVNGVGMNATGVADLYGGRWVALKNFKKPVKPVIRAWLTIPKTTLE